MAITESAKDKNGIFWQQLRCQFFPFGLQIAKMASITLFLAMVFNFAIIKPANADKVCTTYCPTFEKIITAQCGFNGTFDTQSPLGTSEGELDEACFNPIIDTNICHQITSTITFTGFMPNAREFCPSGLERCLLSGPNYQTSGAAKKVTEVERQCIGRFCRWKYDHTYKCSNHTRTMTSTSVQTGAPYSLYSQHGGCYTKGIESPPPPPPPPSGGNDDDKDNCNICDLIDKCTLDLEIFKDFLEQKIDRVIELLESILENLGSSPPDSGGPPNSGDPPDSGGNPPDSGGNPPNNQCPDPFGNQKNFVSHLLDVMTEKFPFDMVGDFTHNLESQQLEIPLAFGVSIPGKIVFENFKILKWPAMLAFLIYAIIKL